jgi:hypothetical protein
MECNYQAMKIRDANPDDAPDSCNVLRRSISELCTADHKNEPAILSRWLGNKTIENFVAWVNQADNSLCVTRCTISRGEPRTALRARTKGVGSRKHAVHTDKHRDCSPLLFVERLHGGQRAGWQLRNVIRLSDVEEHCRAQILNSSPARAIRAIC